MPQLLLPLLLQVVVAAVVVAAAVVAAASVLERLMAFTPTQVTRTSSTTATMVRPTQRAVPLVWSSIVAALAATGLKSRCMNLNA